MLTRTKAKLIRQLHEKKYRTEYSQFLVEGEKNVVELLNSDFTIDSLFVTAYFHKKYSTILKNINTPAILVSQDELENISTLESNNAALAVVHQKPNTALAVEKDELVLALDEIRDPGNLGTIIRIADWYGIKKIIAETSTTDFYNSKVIAATMGSFTRVSLYYTNLLTYLNETSVPVVGTLLEGSDVHTFNFPKHGILLMGNESRGIRHELLEYIDERVTIPQFGNAESLNVSVATAVVLDNWRRHDNRAQ